MRSGITNYTYDAENRLTQVTASGVTTAYTYDANGNMTTRGADAFTYDAENRLTQATVGGVVTQYAYSANGARVKKTVGGTTTYYVGSWFEVTQAGAVTKYYYFGARRVAMKQGSAVTYLHSDHLGSTSVASNASGALVSRQTYYPYGAPRASEGALPTDYTFTGQKSDSDGLMYYGARYYDAALGRFISADTIVPNPYNPQSLNRYAYVYNNPLKYIDPSGHIGCQSYDDGECADPPPPPKPPVVRYHPGASSLEAVGLAVDWFFNQGQPIRYYGQSNSLTQDVMNDPGMANFRQMWKDAGYPVPFSWQHRADERNNGSLPERLMGGAFVYLRENVELGIAILGLPLALNNLPPGVGPDSSIDAVGGILGSLDAISVYDAGNGMVRIEVSNRMDWRSGLRIPGTDGWLPSWRRDEVPLGGALDMVFYWKEPMPRHSR